MLLSITYLFRIVLAIPGRGNPNFGIRPSTGPHQDILAAPSVLAKTTRSGCRVTYHGFIEWMKLQRNPFYHHGVGPQRFIQSHSPRIMPEGSMNIVYGCADITPTDYLPLIGNRVIGTWKITCDAETEMPFIDEWIRPRGSTSRYMNDDVPRLTEHEVFTIGRCLPHDQYERRKKMRKGAAEEIDLTEIEEAAQEVEVKKPHLVEYDLADTFARTVSIEGLVVATLSSARALI